MAEAHDDALEEARPYKLDLLVSVQVWALDEQEARDRCRNVRNWADYWLLEVQTCDPDATAQARQARYDALSREVWEQALEPARLLGVLREPAA